MTNIDLTEAIEAGGEAWIGHLGQWTRIEDRVRVVLTAALPHIERQVREQVEAHALTILSEHTIECTGIGEVTCRACRGDGWMPWRAFREHVAARIARGES